MTVPRRIDDETMLTRLQGWVCPYCGGALREGPHGGLSVNVDCACGARFNLLGPNAELGAELLAEPVRWA